MRKSLLIATVLPLGLLAALFYLVGNSAINTFEFERKYRDVAPEVVASVRNPGLYQMKEHNGKLYATDFRALYEVDYPSMNQRAISPAMPDPIIGWGFQKDSILVCLANKSILFYLSGDGQYMPYRKFDFVITKMFVANDSIVLLKAYDTSLTNDDFYALNTHNRMLTKLNDRLPRYNDGGFSNDGDFVDAGDKVVHFQCNMGRFSLINKTDMTFTSNLPTVDKQGKRPPVIQFAKKGFRLDKKFSKINLGGFSRDDKLFLFSNAYNKREFYAGSYKNEYPVDVYDLKTADYQYSFFIPRKSHANGALISAARYKNELILIYLRKIIIVNYEKL